jgi:DNA recombination protein RmuC
MAAHARQLRAHVDNLGSKAYWNQLPSSPDFVVMYVPLESAFGDALAADPTLLEDAIGRNVIPAGPMTLLSLLKGAGYGWRQEKIARSAEAISELGKELHERLSTVAEHFAAVGESLGRATMAYNRAVGSLESRVFVSARKFKELGAAAQDDIPEVETVSVAPRQLAIPGLEAETGADQEPERRRL